MKRKASAVMAWFLVFSILFIPLTPMHAAELDTNPPTILYSLDAMNIPAETVFPVRATVIDDVRVSEVVLHWSFSSSAFQSVSMVDEGDNVWYGELPPQDNYGYFSFYITALDTSSNEARYPTTGNLTIYVSDMTPPAVSLDESTLSSLKAGQTANITAHAEDNHELKYVVFYYRYEGESTFHATTMLDAGSGDYYLLFTPEKGGPMQAYVAASDGINRAYYPDTAPAAPLEVTVSSGVLHSLLSLPSYILVLIGVAVALGVANLYVYTKKGGKGRAEGTDSPDEGKNDKEGNKREK